MLPLVKIGNWKVGNKKIKCNMQYPKEIQQIHDEFNTASERLLVEARKTIQESDRPGQKEVGRENPTYRQLPL